VCLIIIIQLSIREREESPKIDLENLSFYLVLSQVLLPLDDLVNFVFFVFTAALIAGI